MNFFLFHIISVSIADVFKFKYTKKKSSNMGQFIKKCNQYIPGVRNSVPWAIKRKDP